MPADLPPELDRARSMLSWARAVVEGYQHYPDTKRGARRAPGALRDYVVLDGPSHRLLWSVLATIHQSCVALAGEPGDGLAPRAVPPDVREQAAELRDQATLLRHAYGWQYHNALAMWWESWSGGARGTPAHPLGVNLAMLGLDLPSDPALQSLQTGAAALDGSYRRLRGKVLALALQGRLQEAEQELRRTLRRR